MPSIARRARMQGLEFLSVVGDGSIYRIDALVLSLTIGMAACRPAPERHSTERGTVQACSTLPINTGDISPSISADSACVLGVRALAAVGALPDASRGVISADTAAVDSARIFNMAIQVAGQPTIDSSVVVNFILRRPYDAEVWFHRSGEQTMIRRIHKPL